MPSVPIRAPQQGRTLATCGLHQEEILTNAELATGAEEDGINQVEDVEVF